MAREKIGNLELWIAYSGEAVVLTPNIDLGSNMAFAVAVVDRAPPPSLQIKEFKPVVHPPKWVIIPVDRWPGFGWRKADWDMVPKNLPAETAKLLIKFVFEGDV